MSKIYKCDVCGETESGEKYPEKWFLMKLYSYSQTKGAKSKGYHLCNKCKEGILKEEKE